MVDELLPAMAQKKQFNGIVGIYENESDVLAVWQNVRRSINIVVSIIRSQWPQPTEGSTQ